MFNNKKPKDIQPNHHGNAEFIGAYITLVSTFLGFMVPLTTKFRLEVDTQAKAILFFLVLIGSSKLFKMVAIKDKTLLREEWLLRPKVQFRISYLFYIYYIYDFVLIPFFLGMFFSGLFYL